jgi:hypothetical protein
MLFPSIRRTVLPTLLRWLGDALAKATAPKAAPAPFRAQPADANKAARPALEKRYLARILSNGSLKGNLTDAQYAPIQGRAVAALLAAVKAVEKPGAPQAEADLEKTFAGIIETLNAEVRHTVGAARAVARRFTEQLRENEGLAGSLTDDEYQPILDAAVLHVKGAVEALVDPGTPEAEAKMENTLRVITQEVKAKVSAVGG